MSFELLTTFGHTESLMTFGHIEPENNDRASAPGGEDRKWKC